MMLSFILTIVIDFALLWAGVCLGFMLVRIRGLRLYKALDAIMDHYGPEGMEDKLYLQGFIAINDYLGRKPNCASCKYLMELDCNAPDDVLNGDGFCTGWKARKKSLAILHGIKMGLKRKEKIFGSISHPVDISDDDYPGLAKTFRSSSGNLNYQNQPKHKEKIFGLISHPVDISDDMANALKTGMWITTQTKE